MMDIIFDTATGQLSINATSIEHYGADLNAMLDRHGHTINLRGVQMGITIRANGSEIHAIHLPPVGVRYRQTDQDVLATGRVSWHPDQQIEVAAWCKTNSGHEVTAQVVFFAPRPAQPYPSWTWVDGAWTAPAPYPDDSSYYVWDESAASWLPHRSDDPL